MPSISYKVEEVYLQSIMNANVITPEQTLGYQSLQCYGEGKNASGQLYVVFGKRNILNRKRRHIRDAQFFSIGLIGNVTKTHPTTRLIFIDIMESVIDQTRMKSFTVRSVEAHESNFLKLYRVSHSQTSIFSNSCIVCDALQDYVAPPI